MVCGNSLPEKCTWFLHPLDSDHHMLHLDQNALAQSTGVWEKQAEEGQSPKAGGCCCCGLLNFLASVPHFNIFGCFGSYERH